ncbi:glycosyltransferase family 4 protein [Labilibaculum euxinus]
MKKIDLVYFGNLSSKVGPAKNSRLFMKYSHIFEENGICLSVYGKDKSDNEDYVIEEVNKKETYKDAFKNKVKNNLNSLAKRNRYLSIILVYIQYFYNAKVSVKKYLKLKRDVDGYFFQDMYSCYYFLKYRKNRSSKITLMMRNNGDTYRMLLEYYPKIYNSYYYKRLLKIETYLLANVDKVGFVSENAMHNFLDLHKNFDPNKAFYIHNGLPVNEKQQFPPVKNKITLVCAGAVNSRKGQDIIVDAFSELSQEIRDAFRIIILGDGALKNSLQAKCEKLCIDAIEFHGNVDNVDSYLVQAHGYILCSRDEGLPMSIIEAMSYGKPIFSTRVAGIPELVINNKNGLLISPSVTELKELLTNVYTGKVNLMKMGQESRKLFESSFTIKSTIEGFSKVLNSL